MLGGEVQTSVSSGQNGYLCRPCRTAKRSGAAKAGVQVRLSGGIGKNAARLGAKREASVTGSPFAINSGNVKTRAARARNAGSPLIKQHDSMKSSATTGDAQHDHRDTPMQDITPGDDVLQCDNHNPNVEDTLEKGEFGPKRLRLVRSSKGTQATSIKDNEPLQEWLESTEPPKVSCICDHNPSGEMTDYILCVRCMQWQHKGCIPSPASGDTGKGMLCIDCRKKRVAKLARLKQALIIKAHQRARQITEQWETARKTRETKLRAYVSDRLWKEYCQLPAGNSNAAVSELTSIYFKDGQMVPIHPAPQAWVDDVVAKIQSIVNPANKKLVLEVNGQDSSAFSVDHPEKLRRCLNELMVLSIYHGPLLGKKQELGVLFEVLGLEAKGTYWKG